MRLNICLAALAASLVVATPAFAQAVTDNAQAEAHGRVLSTHSLINSAPLDFGTVAASASAGTVSVSANALAVRTAGGGVTLVPSTYSAARFDGLAAPSETVLLTLTPAAVGGLTLVDFASGASITGSLNLDQGGSTTRTADVNGNFVVYVGGDFDIGVNQQNGYYTGNFDLTAEYQ
jgi:hypothetical protein